MRVKHIDYDQLRQLSKRDKAYLKDSNTFKDFIKYPPELDSFQAAISDRQKFPIDRKLLHDVISKQYEKIESSNASNANIEALLNDNCFTVITAHQPSLMTGPLYYVFKILSTINLSQQLNTKYPDYQFVPIFIIGSEDHDFEEINHFEVFGKQISWEREFGGPVGRMDLSGMDKIIEDCKAFFKDESRIPLLNKMEEYRANSSSYAEFMFKITQEMFSELGLVTVLMDEPAFKRQFAPVVKEEILKNTSQRLVSDTQVRLNDAGFKSQAHAREINVFYMQDDLRARIVFEDNRYRVIDTEISFSESELLTELDTHPERFSPNVIMRPIYQESIFPNLAYIGGGGELAYWMERKTQFEAFDCFFPILIRRNSAMLLLKGILKQIAKTPIDIQAYFSESHEITKSVLASVAELKYADFNDEIKSIQSNFESMADKASKVDPTLKNSVLAEATRQIKQVENISKKIEKKLKEKNDNLIAKTQKISAKLFPNDGLQERNENILPYLYEYGTDLFKDLLPHFDPLNKSFLIVELEDS